MNNMSLNITFDLKYEIFLVEVERQEGKAILPEVTLTGMYKWMCASSLVDML